jgi:hypothetical protein
VKLPKQIEKAKQRIARLEKSVALEKLKARKADTREKIQYGGLVKKSKMMDYSKDVVLGALIHCYELLEQEPEYVELFGNKGKQAFLENTAVE